MLTLCLSTIPPRHQMLGAVLDSLLAQHLRADRIVVSWCRTYTRFAGVFDPPKVPAGIALFPTTDLGPLTKLAPVRQLTGDVVWCDDDCLYGPNWLAELVAARRGGDAVAASTFPVRRLRRNADDPIAQGFGGVLARATDLRGVMNAPCAARWADDVWISGVLAARACPISDAPRAREQVTPLYAPNGLQDTTDRADANHAAATAIHTTFGIWPPT